MKRARSDLHVERLLQYAALSGPVVLQGEDQSLKSLKVEFASRHRPVLRHERARSIAIHGGRGAQVRACVESGMPHGAPPAHLRAGARARGHP